RESGLSILPVSCHIKFGLEKVGEHIFETLDIIRVYTKEPNEKKSSPKPIVVKSGTTVIDIAKELHTNLYRRFQYGRVWGTSVKYPGQKVGSNHMLKDGDILEIH
ncbi:MAG: TGS domain-containing protein, partial [Candidatus Bathyarchaeia archaeon]